MRRLIACLALLCCAPALAQTAPTVIDDASIQAAEALRDDVVVRNEAWMLLESLTTEVGPPPAGSEADVRAGARAPHAPTSPRWAAASAPRVAGSRPR